MKLVREHVRTITGELAEKLIAEALESGDNEKADIMRKLYEGYVDDKQPF